jgi:hypothetical protein
LRRGGGIYLIQGDEQLVEMAEEPYDSEDLLQELLAKYPSLLAGEQIGSAPGRWVLVGRETSLPSEEDGGGRWSVDHLFLEQEAVPTLVEVKRSSDTRIRRERALQLSPWSRLSQRRPAAIAAGEGADLDAVVEDASNKPP